MPGTSNGFMRGLNEGLDAQPVRSELGLDLQKMDHGFLVVDGNPAKPCCSWPAALLPLALRLERSYSVNHDG
jgi:hypothetical protein